MLEIGDLTVSHGAVEAVRGVSLDVEAAQIVALIGLNGAGKSSLLEAVSGMKRPVVGAITFLGERIETLPAHRVLARGIAHVPEDRLIFTRLTVGENLMVGAAAVMEARGAARRREEVLERFPELAGRLAEPAFALSGGQRQFLAVARGLMAGPKLLVLDEPTLGLSPLATAEMFERIAALRRSGLAVLMVDQNIDRALAVSDHAYVLDKGRIVLSAPAATLRKDARLAEVYFGFAEKERSSS